MRIDATNPVDLMMLDNAQLRSAQTAIASVLAVRGQPERPPLLKVIYHELKIRGWTLDDGGFIDPEGQKYPTIDGAVLAQSLREIAAS